MEKFNGFYVPELEDNYISQPESIKSQGLACDRTVCEGNEELDCKECLFSSAFCKKELFDEWLLNLDKGKDDK